ncbi:hypothetical protein FGK63_14275 [Ruegeria sediminis]|uniref:Uncharacterized protein n=1 Tax=Ruegeria sediminis TaxID=2583820 RepID=A0ABY2WVI7_9RHOB|nr:hypothetical protein [Ruegeria sediminis]TMV06321.1 hypothetical protein FGK63_14275 [Ruegeria sediminis]
MGTLLLIIGLTVTIFGIVMLNPVIGLVGLLVVALGSMLRNSKRTNALLEHLVDPEKKSREKAAEKSEFRANILTAVIVVVAIYVGLLLLQ